MIRNRFRGFLPVVVDIETAGLNPEQDAVLEIAMVMVEEVDGQYQQGETFAENILPFEGANISPEALAFNGITDPWYPLRYAVDEKTALKNLFAQIKKEVKRHQCTRAIMVAHNVWFDLHFLNAAARRTKAKSPFHQFSSIDTASLGMLVHGHSVLAELVRREQLPWNDNHAHSAIYDAEMTAQLLCRLVNRCDGLKPD
jgi:ribonuclease T